MNQVLILILGATGAIAAIFIKESVQLALQRRVITWQLFGYLMSWKSDLLRTVPMASIYQKVAEREKTLTESYSEGTEVLRAHLIQQRKARDELREEIKKVVEKLLTEQGELSLDEFTKRLLGLATESFGSRRQLLVDAKMFISDKDAALLGRAVAMNVIQFRTSFVDLSISFEGMLSLIAVKGESRSAMVAQLVDQMVTYGDNLLVAFIRLERHVDRISKQSIPALAWNILQGR